MPYPNINTNNSAAARISSRQTVKWNNTNSRGGGVGRVMFLGNNTNPSRLDTRYVSGSGVGATSISNRRALQRRSLLNTDHKTNICCKF